MRNLIVCTILCLSCSSSFGQNQPNLSQHLQDVSVTVLSEGSSGSGTLITRKIGNENVTFCLSAAHVVDRLREIREVIDPNTGTLRRIIDFRDASIARDLYENGRKIGDIRMSAKIIKYSDVEKGEDLCVLMIRKRDYSKDSIKFYLEKDIPPIGSNIVHIGSLLGSAGSNSMTSGIISAIGRVHEGKIFDNGNISGFPGSSGGSVVLKDGPNMGKLVGVLTRGRGETFVMYIPIRRIHEWCKKNKLDFLLDEKVKCPSMEELDKMPVEDIGTIFQKFYLEAPKPKNAEYKFLINESK